MNFALLKFFCLYLAAVLHVVKCDTPANCTFDDIQGTWTFYEGERAHESDIDCSNVQQRNLKHIMEVKLLFPNVAVDKKGNVGTWTMVYNQGFEVNINHRRYFAFSNWTESSPWWDPDNVEVVSHCYMTNPGWSRDIYIRDWSCYIGRKIDGETTSKKRIETTNSEHLQRPFKVNKDQISRINRMQKSWTAKAYSNWESMTRAEVLQKLGGSASKVHSRPKSAPITEEVRAAAGRLPLSFDWRSLNGQNFVTPVRDQAQCGSCFAFASAAMLEARMKILTNNTLNLIFSPQDVLQCCEYQQGCAGGFPYLIAGRYGAEYGFVEEQCNRYRLPEPNDGICHTEKSCRRYYTTDYNYIGGYFGACNEPLMRLSLVNNGPIVVGYEVYKDFYSYGGGIYHHTGTLDQINFPQEVHWNPLELANHAVLVVGYGSENGVDFWTVKNSWGPDWGEDGYFRIRRGNDECGMEAMAVEAMPIPTY